MAIPPDVGTFVVLASAGLAALLLAVALLTGARTRDAKAWLLALAFAAWTARLSWFAWSYATDPGADRALLVGASALDLAALALLYVAIQRRS